MDRRDFIGTSVLGGVLFGVDKVASAKEESTKNDLVLCPSTRKERYLAAKEYFEKCNPANAHYMIDEGVEILTTYFPYRKKAYEICSQLFVLGDIFIEYSHRLTQILPADTMYRIENIKGRIIEYQQSNSGPDYQSIARVEVTKATVDDLSTAKAIRFPPNQIIHGAIGVEGHTYPYGLSLTKENEKNYYRIITYFKEIERIKGFLI